MPSMEIEPEVLRQLAAQHDQVARDTREWAKPPTAWLSTFPSTYGAIAAPVYEALNGYYAARERAGNALADEHDYTAKSLRDSADAYELADQGFASQINQNGQTFEDSVSTSPGGSSSGPTGPNAYTPPPGGGPATNDTSTTPVGTNGAGPAGTNGAAPVTAAPGAVSPAGATGPAVTPGSAETTASPAANGVVPSTTSAAGAGGVTAPLASGPVMPGVAAGAGYSGPTGDQTPPPAGTGAMPISVPTPFAAAVAAAKEKAAEPAYVVGAEVNDDLILARTLLSGVLAAADSPVGVAWAVSVMRGPAGIGVFITSNEGRGWLPAGVFLPREVSTPWLWDELLGADGSGSPWEGVSDPARVLAEFGLAWGPKANARMSALVSSGPIDPGLRAQLGDIAMAGLVGPAYDVDLREFAPNTADRLGLTGSVVALEQVARVPDSAVRARCLELAADADAQVGRSVALPASVSAARPLRQLILAKARSGQSVPRALWHDLRDADDLLVAQMLSKRVDVGRVGLGELRVDDEVSDLRAMVFERRCNELLFLLEGEATRQSLRDAVYAHEQIVAHPHFVVVPAAVSTADTDRVAGPAVTPGTVTAPVITAGPPDGAVVAPLSDIAPRVVPDRP